MHTVITGEARSVRSTRPEVSGATAATIGGITYASAKKTGDTSQSGYIVTETGREVRVFLPGSSEFLREGGIYDVLLEHGVAVVLRRRGTGEFYNVSKGNFISTVLFFLFIISVIATCASVALAIFGYSWDAPRDLPTMLGSLIAFPLLAILFYVMWGNRRRKLLARIKVFKSML